MQHAIPVLAAAGQRKRVRTQEPVPEPAPAQPHSLNQLQSYLRAHIRERGMPSFQGDFSGSAQEPARVLASNAAVVPQARVEEPAREPTAAERMMKNLRSALRNGV